MNAESQKIAALRLRVEKLNEQNAGLKREVAAKKKHINTLAAGAAPYKKRIAQLAKMVEDQKRAIEADAAAASVQIEQRDELIRQLAREVKSLQTKLKDAQTKNLPQNRVMVEQPSGLLIPKSVEGQVSEQTRKIIELSEA